MSNLKSCIFSNYPLICGFIAWLVSQFLKTVLYTVANRRFDLRRILASGGMPSGHSACVSALTFSIGRQCGLNSPTFAISALLAAVVMYDACGVRRSSGEQAKILNRFIEVLNSSDLNQEIVKLNERRKRFKIFNRCNIDVEDKKFLKERLGHTPIEVLVGFSVGLIVIVVVPY